MVNLRLQRLLPISYSLLALNLTNFSIYTAQILLYFLSGFYELGPNFFLETLCIDVDVALQIWTHLLSQMMSSTLFLELYLELISLLQLYGMVQNPTHHHFNCHSNRVSLLQEMLVFLVFLQMQNSRAVKKTET